MDGERKSGGWTVVAMTICMLVLATILYVLSSGPVYRYCVDEGLLTKGTFIVVYHPATVIIETLCRPGLMDDYIGWWAHPHISGYRIYPVDVPKN